MTEKEFEGEKEAEEEPEVYAVKKDVGGWQFDRRTFLAAAGATAAAAAVGTVAGCGPAATAPVVTQVVTPPAVTQVVIVKEVTATPSPTPEMTDTPTPTPTPTPTQPPTSTFTPTPAAPQARFIKDVTIPDGTVMKPGQRFTKTWRFQNVGSVPWGKGVQLVFVAGKQKGFESEKMGGPDAVDVPDVAPGKTVDVSVDLTAPEKFGQHRSYWRLRLGNGQWLENIHYADIFVASDKSLQETVEAGKKGIEFKVKVEGRWVTWTQPCGLPIPPGAVCVCNCVVVELPGQPGEVPPGQNGGAITGPGGETRWLPCGSPIPPGWTCTCNCVSVPAPCSCDSVCTCDRVCTCDGVCSCVGHCTCDAVHYWYPC